MPRAVALVGVRSIAVVDEPRRELAAGEVRVRTLLSGVSAGTELAFYRGTNPALTKEWDAERRLFVAAAAHSVAYPVMNLGYEEVGEVLESNDAELPPGTRVFGTWGHRSEAVVPGEAVRWRVLPAGAEPMVGIFSHIGATALNGVLDAQPRLGETVAVFGLGVVGQLVAQLVRLSGARAIAVDLIAERRARAVELGTPTVLDGSGDVAAEIKQLTDGRGADVCIEASGSTRALHTAIRSTAYGSRVVALGFYQGEASGMFLGEEFHHNRVQVISSQIGGVAAELQRRWDRQRLVRTFMELAIGGEVRCAELVTHRVPVSHAAQLYRLMDEQPAAVLQGVFDFGDDD